MAEARARAAERAAADPRDPLASPLGWLRPIDSEHSAIWQCLVGEEMDEIARLVLTASGGPFLDTPLEAFAGITPERALRHPTWSMGAKITIDSATLANKGLEVIEAHWLYGVDYDRIDVVVHPQSVVHSAVAFRDGSLKAQLGTPDMRLPHPVRHHASAAPRVAGPGPRPRGGRAARLPGARRGSLPGAADRPRGGPRRVAGDGRPHRRRRGRGGALPRRDARLPRRPAPSRGGCGTLRRRTGPGARRRRARRPRSRGARGVRERARRAGTGQGPAA